MKLDRNGTNGLGTWSMLTPMMILRRRADVYISLTAEHDRPSLIVRIGYCTPEVNSRL